MEYVPPEYGPSPLIRTISFIISPVIVPINALYELSEHTCKQTEDHGVCISQ